MRTIGNILWHFPFFGFISAAINFVFGILLVATVVAAPIGLGLVQYSKFLLWPFGHSMKTVDDYEVNKFWKIYSVIVTIVYLPFGIVLAIFSLIQAISLCLTIVGIPVGIVILKSLSTYLNPVGKKCI